MYQVVLQWYCHWEYFMITLFPSEDNYSNNTKYFRRYIRDFLFWLNQLGDIPNNMLLVMFDVVVLYPHKLHREGLETMKMYLDKWEDQSVSLDSL